MHQMVPDPLVFYFGKSLNIFGPLWWERLHPHNVSMTHLYFKASILRSSSSSQSIANPTRREGATDIVIIGRGQRIPGKYLLPPKLPSGRQFIFHSVANYIDIFHKTQVQAEQVLLNWFKSYDTNAKKSKNVINITQMSN